MSQFFEQKGQALTPGDDMFTQIVPSGEASTSEVRLEIVVSRYHKMLRELASAQDQLKAEQQTNARLLSALTHLQGESAAYRTLLDGQSSATDNADEAASRLDAMSNQMLDIKAQMSGLMARMEAVSSGVERSQSTELMSAYQKAQLAAQSSAESLRLVTTSLAWRLTGPFRKVRGFLLRHIGI